MRIAAGVLLIIAAVFNGCGALGYLGVGGAATAVGAAADEVEKAKAEEGDEEGAAEARKAGEEASSSGGKWLFMGIFLAAMFGLQIGAGVVLFLRKAAKFVIAVSGLGILAEVLGMSMTTVGLMNIFGIVACVFGFLGARSVAQASPPGRAV